MRNRFLLTYVFAFHWSGRPLQPECSSPLSIHYGVAVAAAVVVADDEDVAAVGGVAVVDGGDGGEDWWETIGRRDAAVAVVDLEGGDGQNDKCHVFILIGLKIFFTNTDPEQDF